MNFKLFTGTLALGLALSGVAQTKIESAIRPRWSGAEVGEWTMDYNAAFAAAATNENCKGVVMYFTGLWWCPYCRALEAKVLLHDGWKDYARDNNLYLVTIDNPARNGTGNWCWLWEPDYVAETGMSMEEARQEVIDRYALQTKYAAPGATYNATWDYYQIGYPVMLVFRPGVPDRVMGRTSFPDFSASSYSIASATANVLTQFDQILACDMEDEADNYWEGATLLAVSEPAGLLDFGSRTLSPRDTVDWYKFESDSHKEWTFNFTPGARGATNNVALAIFANPTGSSVASKTVLPSATAFISYTTPGNGTYYLRVTRSGASVLQGYHLSVARRNTLLVQTFEDYAAANKAWDLKATGEWFYGYLPDTGTDEWLRTAPLPGDAPATVSGSWTGPGALMFTPRRTGGAGLTLLVNGVAVTDDFVDGAGCWVALPAGKQTVTWSVEGPAGAVGAVGDIAFAPLTPAAAQSPLNQAVVAGAAREGFFAWTGAALPASVIPHYMVYAGAKSTALVWSPEGAMFEETSCPRIGEASDMDWLTGVLAATMDKTVFWRVDTVIEDIYGRRVAVQGLVSSVGIVRADAPTLDTGSLPPEYDVGTSGAVGVPPLTVGVQAVLGPFTLANVDAGAAVSVAVRNGKLPSGVRAQVRDGAIWLVGVPKTSEAGKAGAADVVLSAKVLASKKTVTAKGTSLRVSWAVAPLGRVAGQFNGFRFTAEEAPGYGNVRMTVSASGKLSGKFLYEGTQYTFAAPSFDAIDATGQFVVTNILARAGNMRLSVSLGVKTVQTPEGTLTVDGAGGFLLYRNNWADAAPMGTGDALANYVGYYTAALPVESKYPAAAPAGTGYLTLTTDAKGTLKYAGLLADGRGVSGSATLLYGPDCCNAEDRLMFYLLTTPAKNNSRSVLYGLVQLVPDGSQSVTDVTLVPAHTYMTWFSANPKSVFGYDVTAGVSSEGVLGFTNILNVVGGYYDKNFSLLNAYGVNAEFRFLPLFNAPLDFGGAQGTSGFELLWMPNNFPIFPVSDTRLSDIVLTFKPKTGLFSGSFAAVYQSTGLPVQQKTRKFAVRGVFLPQLGWDEATWFGFYLVSDKYQYLDAKGKNANYRYNWSYDARAKFETLHAPLPLGGFWGSCESLMRIVDIPDLGNWRELPDLITP